jgi:hypothetical protein
MADIRCPYCFARFHPAQVEFRCLAARTGLSTGRRCGPQLDTRLQAYLGGAASPAMLGPVFGANGARRSAPCPDCEVWTTKRVCPECHNELPAFYGEIANALVALVGPKTSGKSVYITVLVHELRNRVAESFGAAVDPMDDRTMRAYRDEFERVLYDRGTLPDPTQPADPGQNYPLLYRMTTARRPVLGSRSPSRSRSTSLVLFDTAGENFGSRDGLDLHVRYIGASDGIVVLVDPLQIDQVRRRFPDQSQLPPVGDPPDQVLANVTAAVRAGRDLRADEKIGTPVAVALSKVDSIWPLLPGDSRLLRYSDHAGRFDEADRRELHDEVRAWLHEWEGGRLDRHLQLSYRRYSYFAVSSLGAPPAGGLVDRGLVAPFRVEDPVLWLLSQLEVVPATDGRGRP